MGNCACYGGDLRQIIKSVFSQEAGSVLRFYLFDWDDNVVYMPSHIWMQDATGAPLPLTTAEFARRRGESGLKPQGNDWEYAFREFRDGTGDFAGDLKRAMGSGDSSWKAPSFDAFKHAVIAGRPFAIITARGHSATTIRSAVANFIETILNPREKHEMLEGLRSPDSVLLSIDDQHSDKQVVDEYLKMCHFVGVSAPEFKIGSGAANPEEGKKYAISEFVKQKLEEIPKHNTSNVLFGMSDDDGKNVAAIEALFRDVLSPKYPRVKFVTFDTGSGRTLRLKSHHGDM